MNTMTQSFPLEHCTAAMINVICFMWVVLLLRDRCYLRTFKNRTYNEFYCHMKHTKQGKMSTGKVCHSGNKAFGQNSSAPFKTRQWPHQIDVN